MALKNVTALNIPAVGFGVGTKWFKFGNDELNADLISQVRAVIGKGLVHIDGAEVYNTNPETGKAIEGLDRSKLWLTDKYFAGDASYTYRSTYANPYESLKASLKKFGTDYVDLYLLHGPFIKKDTHGFSLKEAWGFLEQAKDEGLAKHIGVSNFAVEDLKEIGGGKYPVEANQIEFSAFLQEQTPGIVEFSQKNGIVVEAYSPLGPLYKADKTNPAYEPFDKYLGTLEAKYGKTKTQLLLQWTLQKGIVPITTTSNPKRVEEILEVGQGGFQLTAGEVSEVTKLGAAYKPQLRQWWIPEYGKFD